MKPGFLIFAFLLAACSSGSSEQDIQTAIAQTQAVQPTAKTEPTATPDPTSVPAADIFIDPELLNLGELGNLEIEKVRYGIWDSALDALPPENSIRFLLEPAGSISIVLYDSPTGPQEAFEAIREDRRLGFFMDRHEQPTDGSLIYEPAGGLALARVKCRAVITVYLQTNRETLVTYSDRLAARLEPLVCR